ncbi:MAG: hypothetical protein U9N81_02810 [Bacillota bacterium]|nr:hypothetical protein [Bacillota bacterium]
MLCGRERRYRFDIKAFGLMSDFNVSKKVRKQLLDLTEDKEISEAEMQALLQQVFKKGKGKNTKTRIMEAAAIAAYHRQTKESIFSSVIIYNCMMVYDYPAAIF